MEVDSIAASIAALNGESQFEAKHREPTTQGDNKGTQPGDQLCYSWASQTLLQLTKKRSWKSAVTECPF